MDNPPDSTLETLRNISQHDVSGDGLLRSLEGSEVRATPHYLAEYGVRVDDGAGVLHFFRPTNVTAWDPRLPDTLTACVQEQLGGYKMLAIGYEKEFDSPYIIFEIPEKVPNPMAVLEQFLNGLDEKLGS